MCGELFNVNDYPGLPGILSGAGYTPEQIDAILGRPRDGSERTTEPFGPLRKQLRPTDQVLALVPTRTGPKLMPATWWLMLDKSTLKPTRWSSFNCRSDRVFESPMHRNPPPSYRSVVIAQGFVEWQPIYSGGRLWSELTELEQAHPPKPVAKQRYLIQRPDGRPMIFGAFCKHWLDAEQQPLVSTGIITLRSHTQFVNIHRQSFPLVLLDDELADWLNPKRESEYFAPLLNMTEVREPFELIRLDGPTTTSIIAGQYLLPQWQPEDDLPGALS